MGRRNLLPSGWFFAAVSAEEFIVTPDRVWTLGAGNGENYIRWIYTDGSGHSSKQAEFSKWHGESIGFWDGDSLIVHTNQIRGWKGGVSEFSDKLETVKKISPNYFSITNAIAMKSRLVVE